MTCGSRVSYGEELAKTNLLFAKVFVGAPAMPRANIAISKAKVRNVLVINIVTFLSYVPAL